MTHRRTVYDISVTLGREDIPFPGDPSFSRQTLVSIEEGGPCTVSKLEMSTHSGTHIDMPAHFIAGGSTLDAYSPEDFVIPAHVVIVDDPEAVRASDLDGIEIDPGDAILFRTENSTSGRSRSGKFSENFVYISSEAAAACIEKKAGLVGLDYITIDKHGDESTPAHKSLLGGGILILEAISLEEVPPGGYTLICLPLKISGGEASPVRAVLTAPPM